MIIPWAYHYKFEISTSKIHFLDLNIEIKDGTFITSTYFKSTDRNGYIGQGSCHHPQWLKSVSKSQFIHLQQNCTLKRDFLEQAMTLKKRFVDKGYLSADLDTTIKAVGDTDRNF